MVQHLLIAAPAAAGYRRCPVGSKERMGKFTEELSRDVRHAPTVLHLPQGREEEGGRGRKMSTWEGRETMRMQERKKLHKALPATSHARIAYGRHVLQGRKDVQTGVDGSAGATTKVQKCVGLQIRHQLQCT